MLSKEMNRNGKDLEASRETGHNLTPSAHESSALSQLIVEASAHRSTSRKIATTAVRTQGRLTLKLKPSIK